MHREVGDRKWNRKMRASLIKHMQIAHITAYCVMLIVYISLTSRTRLYINSAADTRMARAKLEKPVIPAEPEAPLNVGTASSGVPLGAAELDGVVLEAEGWIIKDDGAWVTETPFPVGMPTVKTPIFSEDA